MHGLRPLGVDVNVFGLRVALVDAARTDDDLVAASITTFEATNAGAGQERHEAWVADMVRRGTFLDNAALGALATAIARPVVVLTPSSMRTQRVEPSAAVDNVGAPVFVGLNPELAHVDQETGAEVVTFGGHYLAAVPGEPGTVPRDVRDTARRILPDLVAEYDRRVAELPGLVERAETEGVKEEPQRHGAHLARGVVVVAGLQEGVPGARGAGAWPNGQGQRAGDGVGEGDGGPAAPERVVVSGVAVEPAIADISLEGGPLWPVADDWEIETLEVVLAALNIGAAKQIPRRGAVVGGGTNCKHCGDTFASSQGLRDHVKGHEGYGEFVPIASTDNTQCTGAITAPVRTPSGRPSRATCRSNTRRKLPSVSCTVST